MDGKKKQAGIPHALKLLEQLKATFIAELPERCSQLEALALALGNQPANLDVYEELYRKVHSLKGSGGTHGLPIISQICHQLEDYLNSQGNAGAGVASPSFTDTCLQYIDLLTSTARIAREQRPDFSPIEQALEHIHQELLQNRYSGLIVESSQVMALMCRDALADLPVELSLMDNGLAALERLLHKRFDFLITGKSLETLNGAALISALRASESINRNIKVVMLTSASKTDLPPGGRPDYLLHRDARLPENLNQTVRQLLNELA
jgi:chemotaxis protein histidine kinase CheA